MALIEIHVHHHIDTELIIDKLNNMATKAEWQAAFDEMKTGLTNISDDITRLTGSIASGDLTADEEAAAFTELRGLADKIKEIAAVTPEAPTEG